MCPIYSPPSLVLGQQLWKCIWFVKPKSHPNSNIQGVWEMQLLAFHLLHFKGIWKKKVEMNVEWVNSWILPWMVCWGLWVLGFHLKSSPSLYHSHHPSRDDIDKWLPALLFRSALLIWNEIQASYNCPTNVIAKKSTYAHVHCSVMCNNQDMEAS